VAHRDTDLGQHRLVEGDGAGKVADGQKNVVKHACPCQMQHPRPISTGWVSTHAIAGEVWSPITWIDVLGFAVPAKRLAPRRDPVFDATMLIGIISDTHGLLRPEALEALAEVKHIIHAGDIGSPEIVPRLEEIAPVTAIRGNVDTQAWAQELPASEMVMLAGRMIYVIHDLGDLDLDPAPAGLDMLVSGHSHIPKIETRLGVVYLNPGSAGPRRFRLPITIAIVDLTAESLRPIIRQIVK
jgi:putative phosphoesterase